MSVHHHSASQLNESLIESKAKRFFYAKMLSYQVVLANNFASRFTRRFKGIKKVCTRTRKDFSGLLLIQKLQKLSHNMIVTI